MTKELSTISRDDLSVEETASLANYIENGCPGLTKIEDAQVFKWFELYMAGKTYSEIAVITKSKKDLIVYISYKSKWLEKRTEYFSSIAQSMTTKITNIRTESINTVATIVSSMNKYFGKKFDSYLSTNDDTIIENIDSKLLEKYYKSLEILEKVINPTAKDPAKPSPVNINISSGASFQQSSDSSLDISMDEKPSDLMKRLVQDKKDKELNK
jgi:hypothetical protein